MSDRIRNNPSSMTKKPFIEPVPEDQITPEMRADIRKIRRKLAKGESVGPSFDNVDDLIAHLHRKAGVEKTLPRIDESLCFATLNNA